MKKKLQVFISSTYTDLIEERQAAVEAILASGHIPAGMELFTAGDESQLNVIKRWIDESDIYLLILGGRYGSIEPQTGKSYIQLEYEYAIKTKKPFFSIVIKENALDEKVKRIDKNVLELENPQKYKEFKKIVTSKMCSFFEDTKDIKIAVSNKMSEYERQDNISGWISGKDVKISEDYSSEILNLIKENKQYREMLENCERKLANFTSKEKIQANKNLYEVFDKRVERVLEITGAEQQYNPVEWVEEDGKDYEIYLSDNNFEGYFVYSEDKEIDYLLLISIDENSDFNLEGSLADIRVMIESHKKVGGTMKYKYVIASKRITEQIEENCVKFFEIALKKANVEDETKFSFEVWNENNLSKIEEEIGLRVII